MKTAIVTGSHGFIGSQLCKRLNELDYYVIPVDLKIDRDAKDIEDYITDDVEVVYHLAATPSVFNIDIDKSIDNNIRAFINVCNACKKRNIRLVYASSSCALNANCSSLYGITKRMNEEYARCYYPENSVGVRLYNVYGAHPRKGTLFYNIMHEYNCTIYNNGLNKRHFTYIDDAIDGLLYAKDYTQGRLITVANPEYMSVGEVVAMMGKYLENRNIVVVEDKREFDKENQYVDFCEAQVFLHDYIPVAIGIKLMIANQLIYNNLCD